MAKFVTTSWQTAAALRGSLLKIGALNNGWLTMVPLELVVEIKRVSSEGYTGPICHFEYQGTPAALGEATVAIKGQLVGYQQELLALDAGSTADLDHGESASAFAGEFGAADVGEDVFAASGMDGALRELAAAAGWTWAQVEARRVEFGDDDRADDQVADALRAAIRERNKPKRLEVAGSDVTEDVSEPDDHADEVIDAEFAEDAADAVPADVVAAGPDDIFAAPVGVGDGG
jgi:hypothetical protein